MESRTSSARSFEAIAYLIKSNVEVLQKVGAGADEVRVLGGGGRRPVDQIKADVLDCPSPSRGTGRQPSWVRRSLRRLAQAYIPTFPPRSRP